MAKTLLLHSLQRLAADYHLARAHGLPLRAIRELRAEACRRRWMIPSAPAPHSPGVSC